MNEQGDLIEASKLFKDMAAKGFEGNLSFGYAYLQAIATEYAGLGTEDRLNKKPYAQVFSEFLYGLQSGKIAIVGDLRIMQNIDEGQDPVFGMAIAYRQDKNSSPRDLPTVIINRHIKSLVELPQGLISTTSGIEAISEVVHTMNSIPENGKVTVSEIPDAYFKQYGVTPPLVPSK